MNAQQREHELPMLTRDGSCHIVRVQERDGSFPLGRVWTDLGEEFAVFDRAVLNELIIARNSERRVATVIRCLHGGGRYIAAARLYPIGDEPMYPCVRCGATVPRSEDGLYRCKSCHGIM